MVTLWYSVDWNSYVLTKKWKEDRKERGVDILLTDEELKYIRDEINILEIAGK